MLIHWDGLDQVLLPGEKLLFCCLDTRLFNEDGNHGGSVGFVCSVEKRDCCAWEVGMKSNHAGKVASSRNAMIVVVSSTG